MTALPPQADEQLLLRGVLHRVLRSEPAGTGFALVTETATGDFDRLTITSDELTAARAATDLLQPEPQRVLASLYGWWMRSAAEAMRSGALATKPIEPFAHQDEAVDRMLAQPELRFLLGDEPGTGKTIMSGLYIVEARRKHLLQGKVLVICPAHLVKKWERELLSYFGIQAGIVTSEVGRDLLPLRDDVDTWLVSVDLYTHNRDVREKLTSANASWSLVIFDEAHRLTPTSQYLDAAHLVSGRTRHLLLLTATPHRGKEEFFRELMHLIDSVHYPRGTDRPCIPSSAHFLRRMKEDLRDQNGELLFPPRFSETVPAYLTAAETAVYEDVQSYVASYYPDARAIARIIYGKRTASSPAALAGTLGRRSDALRGITDQRQSGSMDPRMRDLLEGDGFDVAVADDDERWDEAEDAVIAATSVNRREELAEIDRLLGEVASLKQSGSSSKWDALMQGLGDHNVTPDGNQLLIFTEYTDTAKWLHQRFLNDGFDSEMLYGGLNHRQRDILQQRFLDRVFDVLVSTDAGGEGIDLQSAHVMYNWDIPWSMVRLEQRMGRLHRIGQHNPVYVYHLVSPDTLEGRVQQVMLNNIEQARQSLSGRVYDLLDATAAHMDFNMSRTLARAARGEADESDVPTAEAWSRAATTVANSDQQLRNRTNMEDAQKRLADDELEQVNPVHVKRFIDAVAAANGWNVLTGAEEGLYIVQSQDGPLPAYLGGGVTKQIATDGRPVARALRSGAVGLSDIIVFGPTEPAFTELAEQAIRDAALDIAAGGTIHLVDTESYSPYILSIYETFITAETDAGRVTRPVPFLVRHVAPGEVICPEWTSVLRLAAPGEASSPAPAQPGQAAKLEMSEAAQGHVDTLANERTRVRTLWVNESRHVTQDRFQRYRHEIADRADDERRDLLDQYEARVRERNVELDRMLFIDATAPHLLGTVLVSAGLAIDDPETRTNSERVGISLSWNELAAQGFTVHDMQTAGVGFDLKATNHRHYEHRCVEVKSIKGDLGAIVLEQSEWTQAQQLGDNYWLYIAIHCGDDETPRITARIQNPADKFTGPRALQRFPIPVAQLREHASDD